MDGNSSSAWLDDDAEVISRLRAVEGASLTTGLPLLDGYDGLIELGRGGQGVVYSAVQHSTRRRVAIKLLHAETARDPAVRSRFAREVDFVAQLRHPNIVRLYDSGTTSDGRPYLVMDLIEGGGFDEHAAELRQQEGTREIVELVINIARAVHYAHQRGLLHRDLKPSNVRVTPGGTPIVVDFGLAKAFGDHEAARENLTVTGPHFLGSLKWASPEQIRGNVDDIDVRSDVYALGLLLYHSISGESPYRVDGSLAQVLSRIEKDEPEPLRRWLSDVQRDLERVVTRTLEKNKSLRYATAGDLADDLERVIRGEPIIGHGASTWRALRRRTARYRAAFVVLAFLFIVVGAFAATNSVLLSRTQRAEELAAAEVERADAVNGFLTQMLASASPEDLGREATVRDMLERAEAELQSGVAYPPPVIQELHATIATTYRSLGEYDRAFHHVKAAISACNDDDAETMIGLDNIRVGLLIDLSRYDEAEQQAQRLLEQSQLHFGTDHPLTLNAIGNIALLASERGRFDEAIQLHQELYETRKRLFGPEDQTTLTSLHNIAVEENLAGRPERALERYAEAVRIQTSVFGIDHPATIQSRNGLAASRHNTGDLDGAARDYEALIPDAVRVLGEDHSETNTIRSNFAFLLREVDKIDEALDLMELVYASSLRTLGPGHSATVNNRTGVAVMRYYTGDVDGAIDLLSESYQISRESLGVQDVRTIAAGKSLAAALRTAERYAEALEVIDEVLANARLVFHESNPDLFSLIRLNADTLSDSGQLAEALLLYGEAADLAEQIYGPDHETTIQLRNTD
ncbi:MAG: serine/threonine-protein kinase [Planctomycetota bacterium]